ncbi:glutaredoxin [archaeon]|jgi:glutaredoxin 3|nr:glutaredoxin [archaeon]MBT6698349.1 glutaredoxin [archaeon]
MADKKSKEDIVLYVLAGCPFCEKVRVKLKELKLEYTESEVPMSRDDPMRVELMEKSGGIGTVPVIKVGGEYIGDSSIIIDYLDQHFGKK